MVAWGLTDGSAGMIAQVKALAVCLGKPVEMKKVGVKKPYVYLPNAVHAALFKQAVFPEFMSEDSDALTVPWPELVISCGRRAGLIAMGLRHRLLKLSDRPRFIHIQDPQMPAKHFDVIVAMAHDKVKAENVIKTNYALHRVTPEALAQARAQFEPKFAAYPKPHIAVLLGGSTHKYVFSDVAMRLIIAKLRDVLTHTQGSLLITPSRRTGEKNIALLREAFSGDARVYIYDFVEENPYMGLLACADVLVVSDDSVNMMSEAHATGKPIYLLNLPGHVDTKPARFGQRLEHEGAARILVPELTNWTYPKSTEMEWLGKKLEVILANNAF